MFRSTVQITKYIRNKFSINWIHNLKALALTTSTFMFGSAITLSLTLNFVRYYMF